MDYVKFADLSWDFIYYSLEALVLCAIFYFFIIILSAVLKGSQRDNAAGCIAGALMVLSVPFVIIVAIICKVTMIVLCVSIFAYIYFTYIAPTL